MKNKKMKSGGLLTLAFLMAAGNVMPALAGSWQQDAAGWVRCSSSTTVRPMWWRCSCEEMRAGLPLLGEVFYVFRMRRTERESMTSIQKC